MSLWQFFQSDIKIRSPQRRALIISKNQRASFCTCRKASYTLEAAIVIPIIAGYLVTMLFFFSILEMQCTVAEAVSYAGRKTAVEGSVVDSEEALFLSAKTHLSYALKDDLKIEKYIEHGIWGISLWESEFEGDYILLKANYVVELPISFFGIEKLALSSQNCFRKWSGDRILEEGDYVYVTKTGQVYHASLNCRSVNINVKYSTLDEISNLRGKNGQKYYECSRCDWEDNTKGRVYYTEYGDRYHRAISCSALKRNVQKIRKEDVGEKRPCSFCYET